MVELGGEGLVVGEDEGGTVELFDDLGHGEGFSGAGDAEENLVFFACVDAGDEFGDGTGLVALWLVGGGELEVHICRIVDRGRRLWMSSGEGENNVSVKCEVLSVMAQGAAPSVEMMFFCKSE